MDKVIIFGAGGMFKKFFPYIVKQVEVVAISDNNQEQKDEYVKEKYIKPDLIKELEFDYVVICCSAFDEVRQQLLAQGIDSSKIMIILRYIDMLEVRKYHLERYVSQYTGEGSSITDRFAYKALCKAAASEPDIFDIFRRFNIYTGIVETVSQSQGKECMDAIADNVIIRYDMDDWTGFQQNDLYGGPITYDFLVKNTYKVCLSPTTVRYVKILQDIMSLFNSDKIKCIAEIGVGYGGQARLIMSKLPIERYFLIDLPETIELVNVYLNKFSYGDKFVLCDGTQPMNIREYDLMISNYAFSELKREVQEQYMESVLLHSKAGYLIWNNLSNDKYGGYSVEEILDCIPGARVIDEVPLTHAENRLIVWGTK